MLLLIPLLSLVLGPRPRITPLRQYLVMDAHMTWCGPVSRSYEFYRAVHETLSVCSLVLAAFSPAAPCSFKIDADETSKAHVNWLSRRRRRGAS